MVKHSHKKNIREFIPITHHECDFIMDEINTVAQYGVADIYQMVFSALLVMCFALGTISGGQR
ncbi:hypothetical protein DVQ78_19520 [Yersinia enterocolitica]|nr:hypothetical protein [Yersinia enterocolitica]